MRSKRVLVVAVTVLATVAALAGPASAKTDPKKFCAAVQTFEQTIATQNKGTTKGDAKNIEKALKTAAKSANGKVKNATNTLASFYGKIASGTAYTAVLTSFGAKYSKAAATFSTYIAQNCISLALTPTTTTAASSGSGGGTTTTTGSSTATTIVGSKLECDADRIALDAVEAVYKQLKGGYGDMAALVAAGLLPTASNYHTITVTGSSTNATAYTIVGC